MKMGAKKVRIQTTLSQLAVERARRLMEEIYGMSDLNELIDRLIIEEYERRHGKISLQDPSAILNEPKSAHQHGAKSKSGSGSRYP